MNDNLLYKGRRIIPKTTIVILLLLHEYHNSPIEGHSKYVKTYLHLAQEWFLSDMRRAVSAEYVRRFKVCQRNKLPQQSPATTTLHGVTNLEDIAVGLIEGMIVSKGNATMLVVVS